MLISDLYELILSWKNSTYLANFSLKFDYEIYSKAVSNFVADYARWFPGEAISERKLSLTPQLQVLLCYRIANVIYKNGGEEADLYSLLGRSIGQMEIYYSAEIGPGLKINHGIGSVIGARVKIGTDCIIHQNCTLGDRLGGRPMIGNNVIIYAGAMVLGNVKIGDGTTIGANSVVLCDASEKSLLIGSPAKNRVK